MLLTDILESSSKKFASHKAYTMRMGFRTVSLTYAQTLEYAQKIAVYLESLGISAGDRIVLLAPNSPYWTCLFWGCLLRGVVLVPLNVQSTNAMVRKIIEQTEAKLFFKHAFFKGTIDWVQTHDIELLPELIGPYAAEQYKKPDLKEDDIIQILYTSGTTGDPKGVLLTHRNICSNIQAVEKVFQAREGNERLLSILPLSHIFEQTFGFFFPSKIGAHIIYAHSHAAIRDLMQKYKITKMLAVPEFLKIFMSKIEATAEEKGKKELLEKLLKFSTRVRRTWFSRLLFRRVLKNFGGHLDMIACGGAPLDPVLEQKWNALGVTVLQGFGLTETSPGVTSNMYSFRKEGSVGKIIDGVQVHIDTDGQILVKGPNVFKGYYKNEEKTREAFTEDGWFKTGDIGEFDAEGFLFLKGRKKYMILGAGGQNVFPEDIEEALNALPGVADSCVLGIEHEGGQVYIHATLLLKAADADPVLIVEQANASLASYQQITSWMVWPDADFPRSATKKVRKEEVRKFIEHHAQKQEAASAFVSPLIKILAQVSGTSPHSITMSTRVIKDLHLDSLLRIELILRIEEGMGISLDESLLSPETTVSDLQELLENKDKLPTKPKLKHWPRSWWACALRSLGQLPLFLITRIFCSIKVEGLEHLQNLKTPVIFMPNHLSYFDAFAVCRALPWRFRFKLGFAAGRDVLYEEFRYFALPGEFFFNAFPFPRKEQEDTKLGLDFMGAYIDHNFSVVIFPEGTISKQGTLLPLKGGAGLVAVEMGVPVVPMKLKDVQTIFPYGTMFPRKRGTVTVVFGEPLIFSRGDQYSEVTKKIEDALKNL